HALAEIRALSGRGRSPGQAPTSALFGCRRAAVGTPSYRLEGCATWPFVNRALPILTRPVTKLAHFVFLNRCAVFVLVSYSALVCHAMGSLFDRNHEQRIPDNRSSG